MKRLPSFLVIGAQKAGTTTLHDWFHDAPEPRDHVAEEIVDQANVRKLSVDEDTDSVEEPTQLE